MNMECQMSDRPYHSTSVSDLTDNCAAEKDQIPLFSLSTVLCLPGKTQGDKSGILMHMVFSQEPVISTVFISSSRIDISLYSAHIFNRSSWIQQPSTCNLQPQTSSKDSSLQSKHFPAEYHEVHQCWIYRRITLCYWLSKVLANMPVNSCSKCGIGNWLCKLNFGSNQENKSFDFLSGSDLVSIEYVCMEVCSFKMFCQVPCAPYWIRFLQNNYVFTPLCSAPAARRGSLRSMGRNSSFTQHLEEDREKFISWLFTANYLFLLFHSDSLGGCIDHSLLRLKHCMGTLVC